MAGDYGRDPSEFSIVNVMLPRRYYPAWQGNVFERRSAVDRRAAVRRRAWSIDYDQLLAKQPFKDDAVFAWHQDMAYWPTLPTPRTATLWLAIDDSTVENGCMRFVPGTTHEATLRPHAPVTATAASRTRSAPTSPDDDVVVPCRSARRLHGAQRARDARLGRQRHRRIPARLHRRVPSGGDRRDRACSSASPTATTTNRGARRGRRRRRDPTVVRVCPVAGRGAPILILELVGVSAILARLGP